MTSLDELRRDALDAVRSTDWLDAADRFSTESYLAVYNAAVPTQFQVGRSAVLTAELGDDEASSRIATQTVHDLEVAVAIMAKEIAKPGSSPRLTGSDYERASLVQSVAGNVVMLAPPRRELGQDLFDGVSVPTVTEAAIERLVAMVPETADRELDLDALLSARSTTRRAVGKVLESAVRSGGLNLSVMGVSHPQRATITSGAAHQLMEELDVEDQVSAESTVIGVLEGARTVRRRFYLIPAHHGREIWGSVDEAVISDVAGLVGRQVVATVDVTTTSPHSGRPSRKTYRLTGIAPAPTTPAFFGD